MSTAATQQKWSVALERFAEWQREQGLSVDTIRKRRGYLNEFAASAGLEPWRIPAAAIASWAGSGSGSTNARSARRQAVRTFYSWGYQIGDMPSDVTQLLDARKGGLEAPAEWVEPLSEFARFMRAGGMTDATVRLRLAQLERFARVHEGMRPHDVTHSTLIDWLSTQHWSRETRRSMRAALIVFYEWAERAELVETSPARALPRVRQGVVEPRPACEDAYRAAIDAARDRDVLGLRLAAEAGLRRSEVCQVHTRDVQKSERGFLLIVHGKGDKQRAVPLPESLGRELSALPEGFVFQGKTDGHMSANALGRRLRQLLPNDVTLHQLRHRFASVAYAVSNDLFAVQQLLGHASPGTTQRYVQIGEEVRRRVMEQVAERSPDAKLRASTTLASVALSESASVETDPALLAESIEGRVWLSIALRDSTREWTHGKAWLRLEGTGPLDPEGLVAGPEWLDKGADVVEQAELWAGSLGYRPSADWQISEAGAVVWLEAVGQ